MANESLSNDPADPVLALLAAPLPPLAQRLFALAFHAQLLGQIVAGGEPLPPQGIARLLAVQNAAIEAVIAPHDKSPDPKAGAQWWRLVGLLVALLPMLVDLLTVADAAGAQVLGWH